MFYLTFVFITTDRCTLALDQSCFKYMFTISSINSNSKCYRYSEFGYYKADYLNPPIVNKIDSSKAPEQKKDKLLSNKIKKHKTEKLWEKNKKA
jgi:hypothetical protein